MLLNTPSRARILVSLVLATACSGNTAHDANDRADHATDADADSSRPPLTPPPSISKSPLGTPCISGDTCTSGYCTDGVCCDSACGQTCYACNLSAAPGHCGALASGVDPNASRSCTAPAGCVLPATATVPSCKLMDGTACQSDGDCISGHCLTYYVDADGDGYGSAESAHFCSELNSRPPAGYSAYTGDCCDLDAGANPAFDSSHFFTMPDSCGSFDWNCDGKQAQEGTCPTTVACGADCTVNVGSLALSAFTEACN